MKVSLHLRASEPDSGLSTFHPPDQLVAEPAAGHRADDDQAASAQSGSPDGISHAPITTMSV